ncbi:MAG: SDR family NAD(P)-dependent oxidoreductase [Gammaproteobacteria bacterium]
MTISFTDRVAIVTGAGGGLGRAHALALAGRGAKVVVNDLGGARDGTGRSSQAAEDVVNQIQEAGGKAIANGANVTNPDEVEAMVNEAIERWGRLDILINNAGILRDKTFAKMTLDDFRTVVDVHLMGSVICTKAVWEIMRQQTYGRIVMTTSSSGLYGNFGQSNYGAAKMAVIGLMNTLVLEGKKYDIRVNALAPTAATRMTEDIIPDPKLLDLLTPESVAAGCLTLCHEEAPTRAILCAGAGGYALSRIVETDGIYLPASQQNPDEVLTRWEGVVSPDLQAELPFGGKQTEKFLMKAASASKD